VTLFIGPAGWSYEDWAGVVYPKPRPRGFSELAFLSRYFNAIEINTTFYHPIDAALSKNWVRKIGTKEFLFTAKLWQRFTHEAAPFESSDVQTYRSGIEPLRDAGLLGAVLVQFPWSFKESEEHRSLIVRIREAFPEWPLVVELRHISWAMPETLKFLSDHKLGFCNIDQPPSKGAINQTAHVTSTNAYVRFHGRNSKAWFNPKSDVAERYNYLYSVEELTPWVDRIREMEAKSERVFVIGNNHFQGKGITNALQLRSLLTGQPVEAPGRLVELYRELERFVAKPAKQPDLFS
jgi:uncharacterized protein YecE (DUF72 family)